MLVKQKDSMNKFFSGIYLWMFIGLLISGAVAYIVSSTPSLFKMVYSAYYLFVILELIVVIAFSALLRKVSPTIAKILFIVYSIVNGLTLSSIFIIYKLGSIVMVFVSSALLFGLLALYGYFTKQNLTSFGRLFFVGLIAVITMSVINMFISNSQFGIILSVISVVLFLGLTAYDMQMLKSMYNYYSAEDLDKASIYGALNLYLDFINIFLHLLSLFGKSRD